MASQQNFAEKNITLNPSRISDWNIFQFAASYIPLRLRTSRYTIYLLSTLCLHFSLITLSVGDN